jgi:hypothetical protein
MSSTTLYEQLGVPGQAPGFDRQRTEATADDRETIDNDRLLVDLYATLGNPVIADGSEDVGRTEGSRDTRETIDNDRLIVDLYAVLGHPIAGDGSEVGRTEITRIAAPETVDKDRADQVLSSSLTGPPVDLYGVLACSVGATTDDRGETTRTLATDETLDEG